MINLSFCAAMSCTGKQGRGHMLGAEPVLQYLPTFTFREVSGKFDAWGNGPVSGMRQHQSPPGTRVALPLSWLQLL